MERRTIRCFFRDKLKGRTRAGRNVTASRYEPIVPERDLSSFDVFASLAVYTLSETVERHTDTPRVYKRRLELAVEVFAEKGPALEAEALDDLVDELCDQVECVVDPEIPQLLKVEVPGTDERLDVNPSTSGLLRVEVAFDARGVQLSGAARLVFAIDYGTDVDERLQARATDLERLRAVYRFPPLDLEAEPAAEDAIDLSGG